MTPSPQLDHIILLIPHSLLLNLPESLTSNFTILPGGRHADGLTENKLIVLQDGVYLELISFIDDDIDKKSPGRETHWWGAKEWGVIDWALTYPSTTTAAAAAAAAAAAETQEPIADPKEFLEIQGKVSSSSSPPNASSINYADPKPGGRTLPSGTKIAWAVAFPDTSPAPDRSVRGLVPFFCFDKTPRNLRVPVDISENTTHPCGARGVNGVEILAPKKSVGEVRRVYEAVFGEVGVVHRAMEDGEGTKEIGWGWGCDVPRTVPERGQDGEARNVFVTLWEGDVQGGDVEDVEIEIMLETEGAGEHKYVKWEMGGREVNITLVPLDVL